MRGLVVQDNVRIDRAPTMRCAVPGCGESTREKKPVCSEHIFEEAYPKRLLDIIEGAEAEIKRASVRGYKEIDLDGLVVEEILAGIKSASELTWKRLVKNYVPDLNGAPERATDAYLEALKRGGLIRTRASERRDVIVSLTEAGYAKAGGA